MRIFIFSSYLLKNVDLEKLCSDSFSQKESILNTLKHFDVIILEETNAIDNDKMKKIISHFNHLEHRSVWISSSSKSFVASPF